MLKASCSVAAALGLEEHIYMSAKLLCCNAYVLLLCCDDLGFDSVLSIELLSRPMSLPLAPQTGEVTCVTECVKARRLGFVHFGCLHAACVHRFC
jgi:hypothetical protein